MRRKSENLKITAGSPLSKPLSIEDLGVSRAAVVDLALKILYSEGEADGTQVAELMRIPLPVAVDVLDVLRKERLCSVLGGDTGVLPVYRYGITGEGIDRAREALSRNEYIGPTPVSLDAYGEIVKRQSVAMACSVIKPGDLKKALNDLVINASVINQLGPAINSAQPILLYGAPGNGKTYIAQNIVELVMGNIFVPYACEIEGQIIKVFDPEYHHLVDGEGQERGLDVDRDMRWALCERPVVMVGGELTLSSLNLVFDPISKCHEAALQMKANGGIFFIDDFGRQLLLPEELLNRWIVPLESKVDYLALHTGKQLQIPFDSLVIFSTNLDPGSLDEAFLRRIPHKVLIPNPTLHEYYVLFQRVCQSKGVSFDKEGFSYLVDSYYRKMNRALRACHPRDLVEQILAIARYNKEEPILSEENIDRACANYFVQRPTMGYDEE
jgi:predicted ATPase with chaperone activity